MGYLNDALLFNLGGLISVQRKHSLTHSTHYNSGFFITTNVYPDFGGGRDGEAIKKRLTVFETNALPRKDPGISGKIKYESFVTNFKQEQIHSKISQYYQRNGYFIFQIIPFQ